MSKSQRFSKKDVLVTSKINDEAEVVPIRIDHLVDTDLDVRTGEVSYHYNYLLYTFEHHLGVVTARDLPPMNWSILKVSRRRTENGYEASQTRRDRLEAAPG